MVVGQWVCRIRRTDPNADDLLAHAGLSPIRIFLIQHGLFSHDKDDGFCHCWPMPQKPDQPPMGKVIRLLRKRHHREVSGYATSYENPGH